MSFDSLETTQIELKYRTEELKKLLTGWKNILLTLNNLLEWKHTYDPLIILGGLTFIFILINQINPSALTLISCLVLIFVIIDLLKSIGIDVVRKNKESTSINDMKYLNLCKCIAHFEQIIKHKYQSVLKMREEHTNMYLIIGSIILIFLAFCGQRIDNLLLTYLTMLIICLIPGVRNQQLIQFN